MTNDTNMWIVCPDEIWQDFTYNIIRYYNHNNTVHYLQVIMSGVGSVLNLAILFVFYVKQFNTRFDKLLSAYSFASLVVSIQYLTTCFVNFNFFTKVGFYMRIIDCFINQVFVSFCRILDTFLVYERIQIYKPEIKFLSKTSFTRLIIWILTVAILTDPIEVVVLINGYANQIHDKCTDTENIKNYLILNDLILRIICYSLVAFEFFFYLITDLILTLYLLKILKTFHRYKRCLRITACSQIRNRTVERNNTIIVIVLCSISTLISLAKFFTSSIPIKVFEINDDVRRFCESIIIFKYSINFFLFYFLNRKFRRSVNKIRKSCVCKKSRGYQ